MTTLIESTLPGAFQGAYADREAGVLRGVALLGRQGAHRYSDRALGDAVRLYARTPVFLDTEPDRTLRERRGVRSVRDLAGRVERAWRDGERVRGDVRIVADRDLVFDLAESMPQSLGLRHQATGRVNRGVVESLESVRWLELTAEPATTSGLLEGREDSQVNDNELQAENDRLKLQVYALEQVLEAKLPAKVVTPVFKKHLLEATSRERVDGMIRDRKHVASVIAGTSRADLLMEAAGKLFGDAEPVPDAAEWSGRLFG